MNWAEGALQRHTRGRGRKADVVKQKQFFAKARSAVPLPDIDIPSFPGELQPQRVFDTAYATPVIHNRYTAPQGTRSLSRRQREQDFDARRRRLLKTKDWAGIANQKPFIVQAALQCRSTEPQK